MQLLKILGILLLAGVPATLILFGLFLPVDWFELREIGVVISYGITVWHGAGTHFVQNCGNFSILRTHGSGSTYHAYYSDSVQINSAADDCQTNSNNIKKIESCNVKPVFITKEFIDLPYTDISQKIYFTANSNVRSLNSDNLTELINCLNTSGLKIKFASGGQQFCNRAANEKLLDIAFYNFTSPLIYNSSTQKYYFAEGC